MRTNFALLFRISGPDSGELLVCQFFFKSNKLSTISDLRSDLDLEDHDLDLDLQDHTVKVILILIFKITFFGDLDLDLQDHRNW